MTRAEAYLHTKFHLDPSNRLATVHQRYRQTDRQTGQRSDSIERTVLQTVVQKVKLGVIWSHSKSSAMLPHSAYDFLLTFYRYCSSILYRFRDIARVILSSFANFSYPTCMAVKIALYYLGNGERWRRFYYISLIGSHIWCIEIE